MIDETSRPYSADYSEGGSIDGGVVKALLTILCAAMILLSGTLYLLTYSGSLDSLSVINLTVIVFNGLVIAAMYGMPRPVRSLFLFLALVDVLLALTAGGCTISLSGGDTQLLQLGLLLGGAFLLKGVLTFAMANRLRSGTGDTS